MTGMMMELGEWRRVVPHGAYYQPIRLTLDAPCASDAGDVSSAATATAAATDAAVASEQAAPVQPAMAPQPPLVKDATTEPATPKRLKRRQKPPRTPVRTAEDEAPPLDNVVLLPPFQSSLLPDNNHSVINAGGPVWAMDWLPEEAYRVAHPPQPPTGALTKKTRSANAPSSAAPADGGGPTWARDWRILALSTHPPCDVVDGKLVKNTPPDHYYDRPQSGRGILQIWAIPVPPPPPVATTGPSMRPTPAKTKNRESTGRKPRLVYAIDHESGVAWDLQWCPQFHKIPKNRRPQGVMGALAVCFGDGSLQIFNIPTVSPEQLLAEPKTAIVQRIAPIVEGRVEGIIQLSVRWSPHRWNLLLTGNSDGSVALWNIEDTYGRELSSRSTELSDRELEPQRRFQDADTIGKQEAFDWGWGWVAIRAVSWSPFDENVFATTGNDSLFKVWDIREPRICVRSHRIRSTWGLTLQWMDATSIQISGDQGFVYMYDILSGSYQKLHFHPQIDSPVWDLQFARYGGIPVLASACTSGSLRLAPARKIFRAPQHSVEICRLRGEKSATVEHSHKSLSLSFEKNVVSVSAEVLSPATREFCERDASLHRVRLSTTEPGSWPCFMATAGHAGLVIIMEVQEELDTVISKHFSAPTKKLGRPRKFLDEKERSWTGKIHQLKKCKKIIASPKTKRASALKLSNLAKKKGGIKKKHKPAPPGSESEFPQFEMESASEAEYQDDEESESESEEISLGDDNSDDERATPSDDEIDEAQDAIPSPPNQEDARLRHEYQLDLSEEDAIRLAIQMSELEEGDNPSVALPPKTSPRPEQGGTNDGTAKTDGLKSSSKRSVPKRSAGRAAKKSHKTVKANIQPSSPTAAASAKVLTKSKVSTTKPKTLIMKLPRSKTSLKGNGARQSLPVDVSAPVNGQSEDIAQDAAVLDQVSIQAMIYQLGVSEEDALRQAIELSELGHMRRSSRKRKAPTPTKPSADLPSPGRGLLSPGTSSMKKGGKNSQLRESDVNRRLEFPATIASAPPLEGSVEPSVTSTKLRQPQPVIADKSTPRSPGSAKTAPRPKGASMKTPGATRRQTSTRPSNSTDKATSKNPSSSSTRKRRKGKDVLTEEELLALALQTSELEY